MAYRFVFVIFISGHTFIQMTRNPVLISMLSEKAGLNVGTAAGAEWLRNDIEKVTGESLSINTIKRITGALEYEGSHRTMLLDIVARYLGYDSWSILDRILQDKTSFFSEENEALTLEKLPIGQLIELRWDPDRVVLLRHNHDKICTVVESKNSKLMEGDILTLSQIAPGFPLYASDVTRNGHSFGTYTAATINGVSSIALK